MTIKADFSFQVNGQKFYAFGDQVTTKNWGMTQITAWGKNVQDAFNAAKGKWRRETGR